MEPRKVRVFSSSQQAQCRVPPITHLHHIHAGTEKHLPQGVTLSGRFLQNGIEIFLDKPVLPSFQTEDIIQHGQQPHTDMPAPGQLKQPVSSNLPEGQLSVWIMDRSWQCYKPGAFPFHTLASGHWDLALTAPEFLGKMPGTCLIGFECWSEDRLGVKNDSIWQMCVAAFALSAEEFLTTHFSFLWQTVRIYMWILRQFECS